MDTQDKPKLGRPPVAHERQVVSYKIPSETYARLLAHCEKHGTTQTWVVWKSLEKFLEDNA